MASIHHNTVKFDHSPSGYPVGTNFILADITKYIYEVRVDLDAGETSISTLRVIIRYGQYSYSGGEQTPIVATFDFPYTAGTDLTFNLGTVPSSWGYYDTTYSENVVTMALYARVTDASGTYYEEVGGHMHRINYYNSPSPEVFNASRDLTDDTKALFDLKLVASSIKEWSNPTEFNWLMYKRQYYNGTSWVDIDGWTLATGLTYEGILSHTLPYIADLSYNVRVMLKDAVKEVGYTDLLPTATVPFSLGKQGVGVGKIHEQGAMDMFGDFFKNGILQPTIFKKKETDPDPDGMENGDLLIVYNELEAFTSTNFPQEFGTGFTWSQIGAWPTDFLYWTSMQTTSNSIIKSFEVSAFKGSSYPSLMFDGVNTSLNYSNGFFIPITASPVTVILRFKGKVQFTKFYLNGWGQDHEVSNSPKSFAFFGSNDGHAWDCLYDTDEFTNSWKTTISANMLNSGNHYEYLKMVWRKNQDDNGANGTMIAIGELYFEASGYKYV